MGLDVAVRDAPRVQEGHRRGRGVEDAHVPGLRVLPETPFAQEFL